MKFDRSATLNVSYVINVSYNNISLTVSHGSLIWNLQQWLSVTLAGHLHMHFLLSVVHSSDKVENETIQIPCQISHVIGVYLYGYKSLM
jgi:hypothetical protein